MLIQSGTHYRPVVAIWVFNPNMNIHVDTYALLDSRSNVTCCTPALVNDLKIRCRKEKVELRTFGQTILQDRDICRLTFQSLNDPYDRNDPDGKLGPFKNRPVIVGELPAGTASVPTMSNIKGHPHLADVDLIELPEPQRQIRVLIGTDLAVSLLPLENGVRRGTLRTPSAIKTIFGWSLVGPDVGHHVGKEPLSCAVLDISQDSHHLHQSHPCRGRKAR